MIARSSSAARAGGEFADLLGRHRRRMHDRRLQVGRESLDLRRPVGQQRGGRHQQARPAPLRQQQRQHLDRLAQPHVVGEAGAEPEPRQQLQPLHAGPLIRAQRAAQRGIGIDTGAVGRAQPLQRLRQPGAGRHARPVGDGDIAHRIVDRGAGQHAHRRGEAQPLALRQLLGLAELPDRALEPLAIDLDPLAAQQHQRVGAGQQRGDLLRAQRLAVQRHVHVEVQHAFEPERRGLARADGAGHLRPRRTVGAPGRRHAHDDAGAFQVGHAGKQARGLARRPAQRMVKFARIDHRPQPVAGLGGALHRQQQRQQLLAIGRAGVFAQRLAERHVLRARLGGELRRVGGEEGERRVGVAAVLRQIEVHAADQVPGRIQPLEKALQVGLCRGKRRGQRRGDLLPQRAQHVRRQVFRARHHRRRQHQGRKFGCR